SIRTYFHGREAYSSSPLPLWERVARRHKPPSRVRGDDAADRLNPSPGSLLARARNEPPSPTRGEGERVCSSATLCGSHSLAYALVRPRGTGESRHHRRAAAKPARGAGPRPFP